MKQIKRRAPYPEWVQMYRAESPLRRLWPPFEFCGDHSPLSLGYRRQAGCLIAGRTQCPLRRVTRRTAAGRRNLEDVLAFYKTEGRLPINSDSPRGRALAG